MARGTVPEAARWAVRRDQRRPGAVPRCRPSWELDSILLALSGGRRSLVLSTGGTMTEILTESFCERCGTRYTFETAAPRRSRIGRVRVATRGLRNYVMQDESSFSEAMADARSDEERSATTHQLDAFHKTFNFCMTCRQYTCGNCWNTPEGLCLTCAPLPEVEPPAAALAEEVVAAAPEATEPRRRRRRGWGVARGRPRAGSACPGHGTGRSRRRCGDRCRGATRGGGGGRRRSAGAGPRPRREPGRCPRRIRGADHRAGRGGPRGRGRGGVARTSPCHRPCLLQSSRSRGRDRGRADRGGPRSRPSRSRAGRSAGRADRSEAEPIEPVDRGRADRRPSRGRA